VPRIPPIKEMTPALFGVMNAHPKPVIAAHWDGAISPMLDPPSRQQDAYEVMASLYLLPAGRRLPQDPATEYFVVIWLYNEPQLAEPAADVRRRALVSVGRVFWEVIDLAVASNGGGKPGYDVAIALWGERRKDEIRQRLKDLQNWINQQPG
jgi:hypothetical protein